jgi:hypothetical protein
MSSLIGGSQSEPKRTWTHGFFHEGVKSTQFRIKNTEYVRFLPAFDDTVSNPEEHKLSTIPYRSEDPDRMDPDTKTPEFTAWFFIVHGYTFYGRGTRSFLCPYTTEPQVSRKKPGVDPINDVRNYVYGTEDTNLIKSMTEQQTAKSSPASPKPRQMMLSNILMMTDPQTRACENQIGILSWSAYLDLKEKLARRTGRNDPIISPEWEDFLYGDVTHPEQGLMATIKATTMESNPNISFAAAHFSDVVGRLDGHTPWPMEADNEQGQALLANRYNIGDLDKVTNIWSYQRILDYLVSDGSIPYDIIERACGNHAPDGMPAASGAQKDASYSLPTQTSEAVQVAPAAAITAPAAPAAITAPAAPAATIASAAPSVSSAVTAAAAPSVEPAKEETVEKTASVSTADKTRYDELYKKFKEDPESMEGGELPEFFNLCAKLEVSP